MTSLSQTLALLKSGGTQRYHTHAADLIKTQDTAQHAYNVAWLVYALTRGAVSHELFVHALGHDAGERWAGDLPAPTKRTLGIRKSFGEFESAQLTLKTGLILPRLSPLEEKILKLADSLEGARFCCNEIALGNSLPVGMLRNFLDYAHEVLVSMGPAETAATIDLPLYAGLHKLFSENL